MPCVPKERMREVLAAAGWVAGTRKPVPGVFRRSSDPEVEVWQAPGAAAAWPLRKAYMIVQQRKKDERHR